MVEGNKAERGVENCGKGEKLQGERGAEGMEASSARARVEPFIGHRRTLSWRSCDVETHAH